MWPTVITVVDGLSSMLASLEWQVDRTKGLKCCETSKHSSLAAHGRIPCIIWHACGIEFKKTIAYRSPVQSLYTVIGLQTIHVQKL